MNAKDISNIRLNQNLLKEVLLMTATINVPQNAPSGVIMRDSKDRLFQYLCSLISWIKLTSIRTLVFCENGNTEYDFAKIINFAQDEGKILEVLVFDGNQDVKKRGGIGFGEGKIMEYAINNSQYLNDDVNFYKVTGKNFIENFEDIQLAHAEFSNVFRIPAWDIEISDTRLMRRFIKRSLFFSVPNKGLQGFEISSLKQNSVKTVFYKSNVKFFKNNLVTHYKKVRDRWGYHIEKVYFDELYGKSFSPFLVDYRVVGKCGWGILTDNLVYSDEVQKLANEFM